MNVNCVIIGGNLTRNPELSYTPQGTPVVKFGLAVNKKWKGKDGNPKEKVCFVDITGWEGQAEAASKHLKKGSPALIEGELELDQWVDKTTGAKRSKHFVRANRITFLGANTAGTGPAPVEQPTTEPPAEQDGPDDEIPF